MSVSSSTMNVRRELRSYFVALAHAAQDRLRHAGDRRGVAGREVALAEVGRAVGHVRGTHRRDRVDEERAVGLEEPAQLVVAVLRRSQQVAVDEVGRLDHAVGRDRRRAGCPGRRWWGWRRRRDRNCEARTTLLAGSY